MDIYKVFASFTNVDEFLLETLEVPRIVIGFNPSLPDLVLDLVERFGVGAFVVFQEPEDALHFGGLQLFVNAVQVVHFVFPEV